MSNYKKILKKKADFLQYLFNEHQNSLSEEKKEELNTIIYNTYQIINEKFDELDEQYRKEAIMIYNDKLDDSLRFLSNFEKEYDDNTFEYNENDNDYYTYKDLEDDEYDR